MKQHRILFAIHYLELGGAEMSLIGLLQALDYARCDVDLFVYSHQGELMRYIPKEVHLLPELKAYAHIERPMTQALRAGQVGVVMGRLWAKWRFFLTKTKTKTKTGTGKGTKTGTETERQDASIFQLVMNGVEPWLPSLEGFGEYDLAVSFLTPHNVVLRKVRARRKVCWIHTDYSRIWVNAALELPVWCGFDKIVSISEDVSREFLKVFPSLEQKIVEIHNILPASFVRDRAEEISSDEVAREMPRKAGGINLLSVGRFTYPKNYDNVPAILRRINENQNENQNENENENQNENENENGNVKWYLIGYGGDEALIRQKIAEEGMEGQVVILGKKENPYPYIKACDVYVQPSRYEGNAVTVREAQMLGKPVVVTNYPTAASQVRDGIDGKVVPLDNEGCARGIARFLQNRELQMTITDYLQNHDYSNVAEAEKFYRLAD